MPPWSALIASSRGEHSMPSDTTPRISRRPSGSSRTGTRAPGGAHGHEVARPHVAHADDELDLAGRVLEPRQAELVGVRVIADLEDPHDDDPLEPVPRTQDALDLDAAMGDQVGEVVDGHVGRRVLAQPRERDPHAAAPNCSRKRTSPSISIRMSGIA